MGSDFKTLYDLHMHVEALSKALTFFDMKDVFEIISEHTIEALENKLQHMFRYQADLHAVEDRLLLKASDVDFLTDQRLANKPLSPPSQLLMLSRFGLLISSRTLRPSTRRQFAVQMRITLSTELNTPYRTYPGQTNTY